MSLDVVGRRGRAEDEESFSWFFAAEYPAVVRSLCQLVGRQDAEDIAQEAFVRLHQRWAKISRYERPDAWVRRVGINLAITHARRERRRGERETRAAWLTPVTRVAPEADPRVVAAMRTLSPRDQALVVLFYFEDRPLAEAAEILDISVGAAKVALHRARSRLALLLQEEVHDEPR
ncbi:MAG: RNA polymerase sigma factor [Nocardioides sp.]